MTKLILLNLFILKCILLCGQTNVVPPFKYEILEYWGNEIDKISEGQINRRITVDSQLNILTRLIHMELPNSYSHPQYSDTIIITQGNVDDHSMDSNINWIYQYHFDSKRRLTRYYYSSCTICGSPMFDVHIKYNSLNKISKIENECSYPAVMEFYYNNLGRLDSINFHEFYSPIRKQIKVKYL